MNTLNASIVNIVLPSIANAFGQPLNGKVQWTIIMYLVVLASTLLAFGRLADMYGASGSGAPASSSLRSVLWRADWRRASRR